MVFQTINKKLLELGPSLGFLYKKKRVRYSVVSKWKDNYKISVWLYYITVAYPALESIKF